MSAVRARGGVVDYDVIVVGAGPVGLMLAAELRLGGATVAVLERLEQPSGESRGLGFTARAAEIFDQRGVLDRLGAVETSPMGHFGGVPMDYTLIEGGHFGVRGVPQHRIERALAEWAVELGVALLRGRDVVDIEPDDAGVTVVTDARDLEVFTAGYLVCCDGGRSTLRRMAGFDFPGTDATREMYLADVAGANIRPRFIGERTDAGMVMSAPLGEGLDRIIVCEDGRRPTGRSTPSWTEVADAWQRITGESLHGADARWVSAFTDTTRLVSQYRRGRVLIAGDAAHVHLPAGGQGLSLGVQDAANLGWKLAATIRGWAPDGLLDTYHSERHPVAARVLRNTLAQGTLYLTGAHMEPMREIMRELIAQPSVVRLLSGMVSGLDIRYDMPYETGGDEPVWLGRRMPHRTIGHADGQADGQVRVPELLRHGRGVLIDTTGDDAVAAAAARWAGRVDLVHGDWAPAPDGVEPAPKAVLLRPDGYIAWVPGAGELSQALTAWFGADDAGRPSGRHD
ncbi:FAD-dependent monooxygenase [Dactylosporangium sp. NPDC050688]|uniref:FAD-dependent monooxygenase n=1 Tax=Dactylosporangium sp. NPDC050688 TaxID=3157217 RepID=UPI0033C75627